MTSTDFTLPKLRTVSTSKTTGVVELRYAPLNPLFPGEVRFVTMPREEMKVFMFDNIKVGDNVRVSVRVSSWLPVTAIDEDNITIADRITLGRESIVGHQQKGRTPDEIWAGLTDEQKRALIHGVTT